MDPSSRSSWIPVAVVVGIGYALVGILFALPATHVQAWRLGAWIVSAGAFAVHIAYEQTRVPFASALAAWHVASAVALGAFGLAVGANVHAMFVDTTSQHRQLLLLSLGIWPILTAAPAFLVAFGMHVVLARAFGRSQST